MRSVSRRFFLRVGGVLCALTGASIPFSLRAAPRLSGSSNKATPTELVPLGARYLRDYPDELATCEALQRHVATCDHRLLEGIVRDDFRRGDTVRLDGWVLARTEVRVAAAFYLNNVHPGGLQ